jgi:transcription elongation factor GreA
MTRLVTTPAGHRRLQGRLQSALDEYERIVASNGDAADAGDNSVWHDNFAYEENQRQMHQWARRIRDLRDLVSRVEVVHPDPRPRRVQIGCAVTVLDAETEEETSWVIAGWEDGNPKEGRIAYNAPLAQALLGAEEGEVRNATLQDRPRALEIVEIAAAEDR